MDNLRSFGNALKLIREELSLSKVEVSKSTGINEETIRRIEYGKVIPKFETLDYLSDAYKLDLIKLFVEYRIKDQAYFYELKNRIELKLDNNKIYNLYSDLKELKTFLMYVDNLFYKKSIQQLIFLVKFILLYRKDKKYQESLDTLINAIKITNFDFDLNNYQSFVYNSLEIRLLMNIAFIMNRLNNTKQYIEILQFCVDSADINDNIYPKLCHNLAGAYRRSKNFKRSLYYSNFAIESAQRQQNYSGLYIIFYGKGLSQFFLGIDEYKKTFNTSMTLCEAFGHSEAKKNLIKKAKNSIGIDLQKCSHD